MEIVNLIWVDFTFISYMQVEGGDTCIMCKQYPVSSDNEEEEARSGGLSY